MKAKSKTASQGSLDYECPKIVRIASNRKVLTREEEKTLIPLAQLSIRPRCSNSHAKQKKKECDKKGNRVIVKSTWSNKTGRILKVYREALRLRRPALLAKLEEMNKASDKAITKLVEHNYKLIISIAKKFQNRGLLWSDLIQHGSDGLIYAIAKFDLSTGNKLSTFATQWIRQRISRAIENYARAIRIPIHMQAQINEIKYIYRKYLEKDEGAPSSEEIAQIYNLNSRKKKTFKPITREEAEEIGRHMQAITSLSAPEGEDETVTLLDHIRDLSVGPEAEVETDMDKQELARLILVLPLEDQAFIKFKFGLVDGSPKSDAKAAQAFSCTMKEVREREESILEKLKVIASQDRTNLPKEVESFSVLVLSGGETYDVEEASVLAGRKITSFPAKVYESTDKDQMLLLKKKLECLGARVELISTF